MTAMRAMRAGQRSGGWILRAVVAGALTLCASLAVHATSVARPAGSRAAGPEESLCRPAIGYYLVVGATLRTPWTIHVIGASNLPTGSVLAVYIYDTELKSVGGSDRAAVVGVDGLFTVDVHPEHGLTFSTKVLSPDISQKN